MIRTFDIETVTKGTLVKYPTMVSTYDGRTAFVAVGERDIRDLLEKLAESGDTLVGHNSWAFDVPIIRKWIPGFPTGEDTIYLAFLDDETQELGLQSLAIKYNGASPWKLDSWETFDEDSEAAATYAARDVVHTYNLYWELCARLGDRKNLADKVLREAAASLGVQTLRGIYINPAAVSRERQKAEEIICVTTEFASTLGLNLGSSKQVAAYLTSQGVDLPLSEKGNMQTSTHILKNLNHPAAEMILKDRKAKKIISTYCIPYEKIINEGDGRVHPEYTLIRTRTGRSAARNLNVQNLSREFKDFFSAPPGKVLCEYDYSAIEFRVAGWFSQDPTILSNYAADPLWDPHKFFAAGFYRKPLEEVTKYERQIAKSAGFGLLYMGNGFTLVNYAAGLGVELDVVQADKLFKFFHKTYPGFRAYYQSVKDELLANGEVACPSGHVRHYGDIHLMSYRAQRAALRQCVNVKVQNTAAYIAYIALAELDRRGLPHCGFVHDAFYFEFDSIEEAKSKDAEIEYVMTRYPIEHMAKDGINFDIPLTVESKFVLGD